MEAPGGGAPRPGFSLVPLDTGGDTGDVSSPPSPPTLHYFCQVAVTADSREEVGVSFGDMIISC